MSYATDLIADLLDNGYRVEFVKVGELYRVKVTCPPTHTRVIWSEDKDCLYALESARRHAHAT